MAVTITNTIAAASSSTYIQRAFASPSRTASVRLPTSRSVGMSRRLLITNSAHARQPAAHPASHPTAVICSTTTYIDPIVATSPKNTNTNSSPSRGTRTAWARRCAPRSEDRGPLPAISHHVVTAARASPATAAAPKASSAARFTAPGAASPLATRRTGPTRTSSVPRTPSL
jgi:hypothetical protein